MTGGEVGSATSWSGVGEQVVEPGVAGTVPGADAHAAALRVVVGALDDAVDGVASLAADIAASWRDGLGASWSARLDLLGRELARQAGVASDLARVVDNLTGPPDAPGAVDPGRDDAGETSPTPGARTGEPGGWRFTPRAQDDPAPAWSLPGVRLGGTEGSRTSERRGVVVPTLPDQPGG